MESSAEKVAITGAGGQLGSELCRRYGSAGVGLDLPAFDLTDPASVEDILTRTRPAVVINTAAYTQVDNAETDADLCRAVNADGVRTLADVCRRLDAVLVQMSTDYVFGDPSGETPYRETDPTSPQGVYATTKRDGERYATTWEKHFVVRTCGLYGKPGRQTAGNFVETMLRLGGDRDQLRVVADQHCTPTYVADLAEAIRFLASSERYGTYHVVNRGQTTWYEFAEEIFRASGMAVRLEPITTAEYGAPAPRPRYSVLDTQKYHALPGAVPMPEWRSALHEYLRTRIAPQGATEDGKK